MLRWLAGLLAKHLEDERTPLYVVPRLSSALRGVLQGFEAPRVGAEAAGAEPD